MSINTPIYLIAEGNKISLDEGVVPELMQNSEYEFEINTNEDLINSKLVVKKYGSSILEEVSDLIPEYKKIVLIKYKEKYYWGKTDLVKKISVDEYTAYLFTYEEVLSPTEIPDKTKIETYKISDESENNKVTGTFGYGEDGNTLQFNIVSLIINGTAVNIESSNTPETVAEGGATEGGTTEGGTIEEEKLEVKIINNTTEIPSPPLAQGKLKIPQALSIKMDSIVIDNSNDLTVKMYQLKYDSETLTGIKQDLPIYLESYDEENGIYYYKADFDQKEKVEVSFENPEKNVIELTKNVFNNEETIEFNGTFRIGFKEDNFNNYSFELSGVLKVNLEGEEEPPSDTENVEDILEDPAIEPEEILVDESELTQDELDDIETDVSEEGDTGESTDGDNNGEPELPEADKEEVTTSQLASNKEYQLKATVKDTSFEVIFDLDAIQFEEVLIQTEEFIFKNDIDQLYKSVYHVILPKDYTSSEISKILLGIRRNQVGTSSYITNSIEFTIAPSIENEGWVGTEIVDQRFVFGTYNSDNRIFLDKDNKEVLGDIDTIFIDKNVVIENGEAVEDGEPGEYAGIFKTITIYRWTASEGFYKLDSLDASVYNN